MKRKGCDQPKRISADLQAPENRGNPMKNGIEKITEKLIALNEENAAADTFRYLPVDEFAPEYATLIEAVNKSIEVGETRIRQEKRNLEMINDIIRSGMWSMDFDEHGKMTKVTWSQAFRYMLGFQNTEDFPDELEAWSDRLHPEDKAATMEAYWAAVAGRGPYDVEYRILTKQGEYKWFRDTGEVARREDGSPSMVIGTFHDITEKKENERLTLEKLAVQQALETYKLESQHDIEETLEGARTGIWAIELEDGCEPRMYADRTMRNLLGIQQEISPEQCYRIWFDNIDPGYVNLVLNAVEEIRKNRRSEVSYPWNHPLLGEIYVRCGGLLDDKFAKKGIRLKGYHQDITETMITQQKQEKELMEALTEAKRANLAKTEFLSHMSHDIRTPINGILGMLSISEKNPDDPVKRKECREKIRTSAEHLLSLINDVLDISKLESGTFAFEKERFNLYDVLENCLEILGPQAEEQGIMLKEESVGLAHSRLVGSPLHLRQILINIVGNGIKYNRPNGKVSIRTEELSAADGTAVYRFTIQDTGIGMSEEFKQHLFEPFTQENSDARTCYRGTGLGMAITKNLTEQMGGTILVESELGKGSKFTVILPLLLDTEQDQESPGEADEEVVDISGMKILLVEDNEINREITQYMLEDAGVTVINAENGKEAVDIFENSSAGEFDCILMDIMMPVMNGLEAARAIRSMEREDARTVPIIALSANAFIEDVHKTREAGMNEHLAKPLDMEKVFRVIAEYAKRP